MVSPPDHWSKHERACTRCGDPFLPRHKVAIYCSNRCKVEAWKVAHGRPLAGRHSEVHALIRALSKLAKIKAKREKRAAREQVLLEQRMRAQARRAASPERRRVAKRADKQRYRARRRSAEVEKFVDIDIFERDGWFCQLCCKPLSRALVGDHKHPDAPTLDHITPLSRGGAHSLENVQCLCRSCNSAKRDSAECGLRAAAASDAQWLGLIRTLLLAWKEEPSLLQPAHAAHIAGVYAMRTGGGVQTTGRASVS